MNVFLLIAFIAVYLLCFVYGYKVLDRHGMGFLGIVFVIAAGPFGLAGCFVLSLFIDSRARKSSRY